MEAPATHQVLLFYAYLYIEGPEDTARWLRELAEKHSLMGRAIVAEEGINATFEGTTAATEEFAREFAGDARFAGVSIKRSAGTGKSFPKLSVKVRREI